MKLRAGDFIAVFAVILTALAIWLFATPGAQRGESVTVSRDGKVIYTVSLSEDRVIKLPEGDIRISGGCARVENPTCPDKVCEKSGEIENAGEIIICVPNRISVEISGEGSFDAYAS